LDFWLNHMACSARGVIREAALGGVCMRASAIELGREVALGARTCMLLSWEIALGGAQPYELAK